MAKLFRISNPDSVHWVLCKAVSAGEAIQNFASLAQMGVVHDNGFGSGPTFWLRDGQGDEYEFTVEEAERGEAI